MRSASSCRRGRLYQSATIGPAAPATQAGQRRQWARVIAHLQLRQQPQLRQVDRVLAGAGQGVGVGLQPAVAARGDEGREVGIQRRGLGIGGDSRLERRGQVGQPRHPAIGHQRGWRKAAVD